MLDFLWNLGSFIVALGLLITAHEYGHFYVARRCGVKVERFSIGFGKAIWRKVGQDGTEYVIAMIPLGGYVKMLDERVEDVPDNLKDQAFNRKSVWQRIAIVAAGPIANFIFAIIALYFMYLIGVPSLKPVITSTTPGTAAAQIQVTEPMQVTAISGQPVRNWEEVNLALVGHIGDDSLTLSLAPLNGLQGLDTDTRTYTLDTRQWRFDPEKESPITALGLGVYRPAIEPQIALISEGSAAAKSDLKVGDTLVAINGQQYTDWQAFVDIIQHSANVPVELTVRRNGEQFAISVTPASVKNSDGKDIGVLGVSPAQAQWPENMRLQLEYGPIESFAIAADKTWQLVVVSFKMIGKLFTGDVSVKNLSGPISIAQGAGNSANYGLVYFLGFLALISVNLGIINLLPLPVLDGGHLLYYFVEVITGKPVSEKVQEIGFRFGAALLLMLMSIALFNDFARL
ncbi:sigma E protease regulator RseP [Shewanella xiamenensis]|uniref:Zinc metalloprotease n=1 Tax=Shewanella xiamenensis TaxID=332186 RepID=A0AAE4TMC3_9GAMM|nr:sigma E protease regulator RseP [Shewanella xiamenensis]MBW0280863.1 RIP metalloprotease RseP [Shewanella xiamenensis]MCT8870346.1 sigma E protease regulator RseP [Shewanella xiamenensis]MDG5901337.1 sigma E protease regulator RseP [Shewanella xiamenensis]MDH1313171.1 sigma E protease regulator RseP [Shewanella xiamenensis]MDI5836062.1 sigma E protease regulator RseP [Shewanella xiamenensis]